jgi:hypothetical protein
MYRNVGNRKERYSEGKVRTWEIALSGLCTGSTVAFIDCQLEYTKSKISSRRHTKRSFFGMLFS